MDFTERCSASIIVCLPAHVINLSIIQGVVPDDLKSSRAVPLLKTTKQRPVTIALSILKIV